MNIKDIAKIAGVGVTTVSRVINNHPDVKLETRKKIKAVIEEYNYIPNNTARLLKQSNKDYIGVLVKGVFNPFFAEMVKVIEEMLKGTQYTMILQHDDKETEDINSLVGFVKERKLKGVIYLGGNFADVAEERFKQIDCKVVVLCSNIGTNKMSHVFSSVGIDDYKAAYDMMQYILDKGHKQIGLVIADKNDVGVGRERVKGYYYALQQRGIQEAQIHIIEGHYTYRKAYENTKKCFEAGEKMSVICALADVMAIGAAKAAVEAGYTIGQTIGISGFDGMDDAKYYNPSITTMAQPREEIAKQGVLLLLALLEERTVNQHIVLPTQLVETASV